MIVNSMHAKIFFQLGLKNSFQSKELPLFSALFLQSRFACRKSGFPSGIHGAQIRLDAFLIYCIPVHAHLFINNSLWFFSWFLVFESLTLLSPSHCHSHVNMR